MCCNALTVFLPLNSRKHMKSSMERGKGFRFLFSEFNLQEAATIDDDYGPDADNLDNDDHYVDEDVLCSIQSSDICTE